NRAQLLRWPGGQSSWSGFYELHQQAQRLHILLGLLTLLALGGLLARYPMRPVRPEEAADAHRIRRDAVLFGVWVFLIYLAVYVFTVILRGSFDARAINLRIPFIRYVLTLSTTILLTAAALHLGLRRNLAALRIDALGLVILTIALNLIHCAVFG